MNTLDLQALGLEEMNEVEMSDVDGGIMGLLFAYAFQAAVVGSLAAGVYASFKSGYDAVQ